jgi:hypothetical protein
MTMWPVSRDVNAPKNDRADLLEPTEDACGAWPASGKVERTNEGDSDCGPTNSE